MSDQYLIVGLGNPGSRYADTRHNVGFRVTERMAQQLKLNFRAGKGDYLIASTGEGSEGRAAILLLKPLTFMNNSGVAVRQALDYFHLDLSRTLIIFDDYQLPWGKLRLRPQGSDGGHNGMQSVIYHLGTEEVPRLRLGIGNEFAKGDLIKYVLSPFSREEQEQLPEILDRAAEAALSFVTEGIQQTMNRFNT